MRKINKIINIALIFMLIGVFLWGDFIYASGITTLRVPIRKLDYKIEEAMHELARQAVATPADSKRCDRIVRGFGDKAAEIYKVERLRLEQEIFNINTLYHEICSLGVSIIGESELLQMQKELPEAIRDRAEEILDYFSTSRKELELKHGVEKKLDRLQENEWHKDDLALFKIISGKIDTFLNDFYSYRELDSYKILQIMNPYVKFMLEEVDFKKGMLNEPSAVGLNDFKNLLYSCFRWTGEVGGIEFKVVITENCPQQITISPLAIFIIASNLIKNGYTAMERRIEKESPEKTLSLVVKFDQLLSDPNKIVLTVEDEGVGISNNRLKKVFKPYVSTKTSYKHGPVGLGLSIVKNIVETCNGTIDIQSQVGKGTTFTITLPIFSEILKNRPSWSKKIEAFLEKEGITSRTDPHELGKKLTQEFGININYLDRRDWLRTGISSKLTNDFAFFITPENFQHLVDDHDIDRQSLEICGITGPGVCIDMCRIVNVFGSSIYRGTTRPFRTAIFHEFLEYLAYIEGDIDQEIKFYHDHESIWVMFETLKFANKVGELDRIMPSWEEHFQEISNNQDYPVELKAKLSSLFEWARSNRLSDASFDFEEEISIIEKRVKIKQHLDKNI